MYRKNHQVRAFLHLPKGLKTPGQVKPRLFLNQSMVVVLPSLASDDPTGWPDVTIHFAVRANGRNHLYTRRLYRTDFLKISTTFFPPLADSSGLAHGRPVNTAHRFPEAVCCHTGRSLCAPSTESLID